MAEALIALLRPHKRLCQTITFDNGKEFAQHALIAHSLGANVYFAHPCHSWERGLNENTHGLLRQYFPKGSDLSGFSQADLNAVAWQLNTLPRKSLGFKYPAELFMPESFGFFKHHHQFVALPT